MAGWTYLNARVVAGSNSIVTVRHVAVVGQASPNNGGFLSCVGCVLIMDMCYIAHNTAKGFGGGIQARPPLQIALNTPFCAMLTGILLLYVLCGSIHAYYNFDKCAR